MNSSQDLPQVFEDDSIDLIALLKQLYKGRALVTKSAIVAAVCGVVIALLSPNIYTSKTTFIPQTGGEMKAPSGLSGLASLAGINLGSMGGGSEIPTTLYPQIISSIPYRMDLLNKTVDYKNESILISDYLLLDENVDVLAVLHKYTIGLPGLLKKSLSSTTKDSGTISDSATTIQQITQLDQELFKKLDNKLLLSLNEKEGFITLEFSDRDKYVASQITEYAKNLLQDRIISYKNLSARELLNYTAEQYEINKNAYEQLQDSVAIITDANLNVASSLYRNKFDRLKRELNISAAVVEQLASQVEQAKLQVSKDTPVFTVLEPVTIPFERSAPKRSLIVVIWTFLGVVLSVGYVLLKDPFKEILASIKE